MTVVDIDVDWDSVRAIPVTSAVDGTQLIAGPARLVGWSLRDAGLEGPASAEGQSVAPAAGTTIAQVAPGGGGFFQVSWGVQLIGAAAAADQDNFGLYAGATLLETSLNAGAAGQYPQTPIESNDVFGVNYVVKAIGAGTAGVTYAAQVSIQPAGNVAVTIELQDGNQAIAEIVIPPGGASNAHFGHAGIRVLNQIKLHLLTGNATGSIYAAFERD